jgi:Hemerythrin HHE cation binding domain
MAHDFSVMLAVHDAVRRDLIRFVTLLGGTAPVGVEQAAALGRQWELVAGRVVEHERLEDEVLWPAAREVVPVADQAPLDRMARQHEQLTGVLEVVSARFATGAVVCGGPARADLADGIEGAAVMADAQFAFEERNVLPLLDRWLPTDQWARFVSVQRAPSGPLRDPVALPWLLEGSRPDRVATVLGLIGQEHQLAYEQDWKPAHRLRAAEVW